MLFIHLYFITIFAISIIISVNSDEDLILHRFRRIAVRAHKHRNGTKPPSITKPKTETDAWGESKMKSDGPDISKESDEMVYPDGYFIAPGGTDAPEVSYDYAKDKFDRPYLTEAEWKSEIANKTHRYNITTKESGRSSILRPIAPVEPPTAVAGVLGPIGIW